MPIHVSNDVSSNFNPIDDFDENRKKPTRQLEKSFHLTETSSVKQQHLESFSILGLPWDDSNEPSPLPAGWEKKSASQKMIVHHKGGKVVIPKGDIYYTYEGKVAIGWHGTYNPPRGMD